MKTIIHVNQHEIKANAKNGTSPDKPLSCGARVWIETQAEVEIVK